MNSKTLCFLLLLVAWNLTAQTSKIVKVATAGEIVIRPTNQPAGEQLKQVILGKGKSTSSPTHEKRMIVRLKGESLIQGSQQTNGRARSLESEHQLFKQDFQKIHQSSAAGKSSIIPKVLYEYKNTFNGFSIITDSESEQKIKELPYVEYVTEDKKVEAIDNISNQIIKAEQVWSDLNITGRGVVIGIIDTGIDYTHPDLGGSIGAGSKVIGGYDFVNEDADPMDDHGHGTHVAGIAAANGVIKGVAPDAKLVAFKVLTAEGWGYDSWILAAIERTVDPDQNPNTDDALDVVNMSLGRAADVNDPYSEAINNATLQGVTFVVAAGNSGDYQTVGTPGVAESAITVAASDANDFTAYFSSKGPTPINFQIKPDVAAPGVNIYSTFPGSQYQSMSGTSMASPHVAGAVALLLEKHPTWSPKILKSALMNTCKPGVETIWHQGAGRIDILKAIQQEVLITGSVSLGLLDNEAGSFSKSMAVSVTNLSSTAKSISFEIAGNIVHPAIMHSVSPSTLMLSPNQSSEVTLNFTIDPSQLPRADLTEGYFGKLIASFDESTIVSNIALSNPNRLKINMTGELPGSIIAVGTDNPVWKAFNPTSSQMDIILPTGTYNLTGIYYPDHYVIKEGVSNSGTLEFDKSQASNQIVFAPKLEDGTEIRTEYYHTGTTTLHGYNISTLDSYLESSIFISNSNSYRIEFHLTDTIKSRPNTLYSVGARTAPGISESQTLSNNPADYTKVNLTLPELEDDFNLTYYNQMGIERSFELVVPSTIYGRNPVVTNPMKIMLSQDDLPMVRSVFVKLTSNSSGWESGGMKAMKSDQLGFYDRFLHPFDTLSNVSEFDYNLGQSLLRWNGSAIPGTGQIYISNNHFPSPALFSYHYGDIKKAPIQYQLKSNNEVVEEGTWTNELYEDQYTSSDNRLFNVGEQAYQLILTFNQNNVAGTMGLAKATLHFDMQLEDKKPPHLEMLSLEADGVSVNTINSNAPATLKFEISDDYCFGCGGGPVSGIESSSLLIRKSESNDWTEIPTQSFNGTSHQATLYGLEDGHYDLKLISKDNAGNSLAYELNPGFIVNVSGTIFFEPVSLLAPEHDATGIFEQPEFQWTTSPSSIYYTLQLSKENDFSSIAGEYKTNKSTYTPPSKLDFLSQYYWRVRATYAGGSSDWSETFSFTTRVQPPVTLVAPVNMATNVIDTPEFKWTAASLAISYTLQLSQSANFLLILEEHLVEGTTYLLTQPLSLSSSYYWRVRANFADGPSDWSAPFIFTTKGRTVTLLNPDNGATNVSLRPFFNWTTIPEAYWYRIQISKQPNFANTILDNGFWENSLELTSPLSYSTKYYWRVQVYNLEGGYGEWSSISSFTTKAPPVFETISLLTPTNASTDVSIQPEFKWTLSSDAENYTIQISQQVNFSTIEFEYSSTDTVFTPDSYLNFSSLYVWRVRANYELQSGDWSSPFIFSTDKRASVLLAAPANATTDVSITPEFRWTKVPFVDVYVLQLSHSADFSAIEKEIVTIDTVYKPSENYKLGSRYYWRVLTYYKNSSSEISTVFHFNTIPGIVTLLEPKNHIQTTSKTIEFKWNAIPEIKYYHFALSKNPNFDPTEDVILVEDTVYHCPIQLLENHLFFWRVRPYNFVNGGYVPGTWTNLFDFSIVEEDIHVIVTGVDEETEAAKVNAHPNPFSSETKLTFNLSEPGEVTFQILDINGREIKSFHEHYPEAGKQFFTIQYSPDTFGAEGFYFCKIRSKSKVEVIKLMLKL